MTMRTPPEIGGMGHSVPRKEDPRFIRGKGNYVDDVKLPGMLHLDIVRSPVAHARITCINTEKALAIPGVLAVLTGKDLEQYNLAWMPTLMGDTQMVLPVDTVKYDGQEVAAVLATDRYTAADGVNAVEVEYDPLPVVVNPFKALAPDATIVRKTKRRRATTSGTGRLATGTTPTGSSGIATSRSKRTFTYRASTSLLSRLAVA